MEWHHGQAVPLLSFEPVPMRLRAFVNGEPALDTRRGVLVWEPRRIVPVYAVPQDDLVLRIELTCRLMTVASSLLTPSRTRSTCAYKGIAAYVSTADDRPAGRDIAWSYSHPLDDAVVTTGRAGIGEP